MRALTTQESHGFSRAECQTTFSLLFAIWLLTEYFQTVPKPLEEPAFIDGCNHLQSETNTCLQVASPKHPPPKRSRFRIYRQTQHRLGLDNRRRICCFPPLVLISLFLYRYIMGGLVAGGAME
jgi:multiple sugar transport system permease protein